MTKHIKLSESEQAELENAEKNHPKSHVRQRCQAVLLNSRGYTMSELMKLYEINRETICYWLQRWEKEGLSGLEIKSGRGRKKRYGEDVEQAVQAALDSGECRSAKEVQSKYMPETSLVQVRRRLRQMGYK